MRLLLTGLVGLNPFVIGPTYLPSEVDVDVRVIPMLLPLRVYRNKLGTGVGT